LQCRSAVYFAVVDGGELIADLNTSFSAWTVRIDASDGQNTVFLSTPDAIVRNLKFPFLLEIDDPKDDRRRGEQDQKPGGKPDLKVTLHVSRRQPLVVGCASPKIGLHVRCHENAQSPASKSLTNKDLNNYKRKGRARLRFLETIL